MDDIIITVASYLEIKDLDKLKVSKRTLDIIKNFRANSLGEGKKSKDLYKWDHYESHGEIPKDVKKLFIRNRIDNISEVINRDNLELIFSNDSTYIDRIGKCLKTIMCYNSIINGECLKQLRRLDIGNIVGDIPVNQISELIIQNKIDLNLSNINLSKFPNLKVLSIYTDSRIEHETLEKLYLTSDEDTCNVNCPKLKNFYPSGKLQNVGKLKKLMSNQD